VEKVDKTRTADSQGDLFDSLDQAVALGHGQRVLRRHMTAGDWLTHLGHIADNVVRVNASSAKENRRYSALSPYLSEGLVTERAEKAWREANPGQVLP
jgi:hypothetical protein